MTAPWWTLADQAELDLILWEFIAASETHRERCWECHERTPCPQLAAVVLAILEWKEGREAESFALGMRRMQAVIDELLPPQAERLELPENVVPLRRAQ